MQTYAIQRVGDAYDHLETKGEVDAAGFKALIDAFPWAEQHTQWDELQDGPLPALVLLDDAAQRELWVTALSEDTSCDFQVHVAAMRKRRTLFGKEKIEKDVQTADVGTRIRLDALIDLMFEREFDAMDRAVDRLLRDADGD